MGKNVLMFSSRWLLFLSFFLTLYGLAMVFAPQMMNTTFVAPLLYHTDDLRSAYARIVQPDLTFLNILNSLLGTVTVGYSILIGWLVVEPFQKGEKWAWNALGMSIVVWAILEGYVKLSRGLGLLSMAHIGLLVAFGIPLLATYRCFHPVRAINKT